MIFFGRKEKQIKHGRIKNVICPECKENATFDYWIFTKYFHVYWIPFFPYKKVTLVDCEACGSAAIEPKQFSINIKQKLQREHELSPARTPIWTYSGVFILLLFIVWAIFQSSKAQDNYKIYRDNPKIGDVYYLNYKPGNQTYYTTMKVASIESDSIHFMANDTMVTKFKKAYSNNKDEYYSSKIKTYTKAQIHDLFLKDSIYRIERDK